MKKINILIVGIGGVGGYYGALLAKQYEQDEHVDVYFLARGTHMEQIRKDGLRLIENGVESIAYPTMASDKVEDFGPMDYVFLCTKSYDLESSLAQVIPILHEQSYIIPLQNGVNNREIILKNQNIAAVAHACVYLISRIEKPGLIVKKGQVDSMYFGLENQDNHRLTRLQEILQKASVKAVLTTEIEKIIWEKFIFLSSIATATTFFDMTIHPLLADDDKTSQLCQLIQEVTQVALAQEIDIEGNQEHRVMNILRGLPAGATASMHSDFQKGKTNTEVEGLTGYVLRKGSELQVPVHAFKKMYAAIKARVSS